MSRWRYSVTYKVVNSLTSLRRDRNRPRLTQRQSSIHAFFISLYEVERCHKVQSGSPSWSGMRASFFVQVVIPSMSGIRYQLGGCRIPEIDYISSVVLYKDLPRWRSAGCQGRLLKRRVTRYLWHFAHPRGPMYSRLTSSCDGTSHP